MPDEAREVTTFCPRCGRPLVWSARPVPGGGVQRAVTAFACHCPLSEEEWDDLTDRVGTWSAGGGYPFGSAERILRAATQLTGATTRGL